MKRFGRWLMLTIALCAMLTSGVALAEDWPQLRGVNQDGISGETDLLDTWPSSGPKEVWRVKLGEGYSAIAVVGDSLFTLFAEDRDEFAASFDAATGKERWRVRMDSTWKDGQGNGPRSTPTVDGDVVYVVSGGGKFYALSARDGKEVWHRDLRKEYSASIPRWGFSASPVIDGNRVLLEVGGAGNLIMAFDKKTGKEVWGTGDDKPGYSTPVIVDIEGDRQALFFTGKAIYAVSPDDGIVHWKMPWNTSWDVNAAMPVVVAPGEVFFASGYDTGGALLKITKSGAKEVWASRDMKNQFSTSIYHDGHLYGFNNKILVCMDAKTGTIKWRERGYDHGSLILADGHLVIMGEHGQLGLAEATPDGYREKGKFNLFRGKTWTMPVLSGGKLYLRDEKEMVALDVSG
jgi:outer membrane protein assembly factor BamB